MLRKATQNDAADIEAFLAQHAETSMFLRGNLATEGVGRTEYPNSTDFYIWHEKGEIAGVFGLTQSGFLLAQMPTPFPEAYTAFRKALTGQSVLGVTGPCAEVEDTLNVLGLGDHAFQIRHDEPLYSLDLADLPDMPATLRRPDQSDLAYLPDWFLNYEKQTGWIPPGPDHAEATRARAEASLHLPDMRLMIEDGQPVAMSNFNARVADVVQIGGVYVPPEHRRRGFARQIVAAQLAEARANGTTRAILFANNPPAARAYEGIGFKRIGEYRIALLEDPAVLEPCL